jgi:uncharacterized protein
VEALDLARVNLSSPTVLAFVLGVLATVVRSDLRFPQPVYVLLSTYLLLAIGLKGGSALGETSVGEIWGPTIAALALGVAIPLGIYWVSRRLGRMPVADAAALAAHYGSVSAVTYTATIAFLGGIGVSFEGFMPAMVAIMEVPAIVVAISLAASRVPGSNVRRGIHDAVTGRSVMLLVGGIVIGFVAGPERLNSVNPFFVDLFQGVLLLFLLEMGATAAERLSDIPKAGRFLIGLGILAPILQGAVGVALGHLVGLSIGGATTLGVLAASASYIAAPAAVRAALPEARPSIYLTGALAITFPFNLIIGIPLYYQFALWMGS